MRTALERVGGPPVTRYPQLAVRRQPGGDEVRDVQEFIEACPLAARSQPGFRDMAGPEGRIVAERRARLVEDGVPMQTLSKALGHGRTWVHGLLGRHDLCPRIARSTSRRTRTDADVARVPEHLASTSDRVRNRVEP